MGKKTETLLEEIQAVFKKHPKDEDIMIILADAYLDKGLPELAETWYSRLLESETKSEQAYLNLITCYIQQEKYKDAEKYYQLYLRRWKKNHKVHLAFIRLLLSRGKWARAAEETEKLLPYVRNPLAIIRDAAAYRRKAKQYMKAAMHYRTLIASEPQNADYVYQFVFCLVKEGKLQNALDVIKKFHIIHPADETGMQIEAALFKRIEAQN
jgi:Tfp pilus assembly protein PilF